MSAMMTRSHRGFTLTELALVLGVIGLILSAAWTAAGYVSESRKISRATQQILETSNNVKNLYAMRPVFKNANTLINSMLIAANAIPTDLLSPTATNGTNNAWNGDFRVYGATTFEGASRPNVFRISYYNIPLDACIGIANAIITNSGTAAASPIQFVTACGVNTLDLTANAATTANITTACQATDLALSGCTSTEFNFKLTQ